jgi:hypothetical protein
MGIGATGINAFRARIDEILRDVFPVTLILPDSRRISAAGVGGKAMSDFIEGGEKRNFTFPFRAPITHGWTPTTGDSLEWLLPDGTQLRMEITETSIRPHEGIHALTCKYRKP